MAFAESTSVSVDRSKIELSNILSKYGATGFQHGWMNKDDHRLEQVTFQTTERLVRFTLKVPLATDRRFAMTPGGQKRRTEPERIKAWEQACRSKWRALLLCVKAKLEAVQAEISTFEDEFLAHIVDPVTSRTVGEITKPQLAERYESRGPLGLPAPEKSS